MRPCAALGGVFCSLSTRSDGIAASSATVPTFWPPSGRRSRAAPSAPTAGRTCGGPTPCCLLVFGDTWQFYKSNIAISIFCAAATAPTAVSPHESAPAALPDDVDGVENAPGAPDESVQVGPDRLGHRVEPVALEEGEQSLVDVARGGRAAVDEAGVELHERGARA